MSCLLGIEGTFFLCYYWHMISWRKGFLTGSSAQSSRRKIISGIKKNKFQPGIYVVALASNGIDVLDIIPSFMLNSESNIEILALAKGKQEAESLCEQLIMEVYEKTGGFEIRSYYS